MPSNEPHPARDEHVVSNETADSIDRLTGTGRIYKGTTLVASAVDYDLFVPAEGTGADSTTDAGRPRVPRGRLLATLYTFEGLDGTHTLELEDGRRLDFHLVQTETNEIVGESPLEEAPSSPRR